MMGLGRKDSRQDMTERERDELLLRLEAGQESIVTRLGALGQDMNTLSQQLLEELPKSVSAAVERLYKPLEDRVSVLERKAG